MTATATKTPEQLAAEALDKFNDLFEGDDSLTTVPQRLKALESLTDGLKGLDAKKVSEELDRLKAQHESFRNAIKNSKRGYLPGIEDASDKFSVMRVLNAVTTKNWKDAGFEKSILDEVREKTAQQVGVDPLGGHWVPDQVIPDVIEAIYTRSAFIRLDGENGETSISVYDGLTGSNVKIPKFEGGMLAYWLGEQDPYVESNVLVGDVTMNPKKLTLLLRMTDAMRRFGGQGFETRIRKDMARALAKKLDWTIPFGTGTDDMPKGIMKHTGIKVYRAENDTVYTWAAANALTSWAGGVCGFDDLMNMDLALEEDDISPEPEKRWISCPRFFSELKKSKIENYSAQTSGNPYLLGAPMLSNEKLAQLIGPFGTSNQISSTDAAGFTVGGTATGGGTAAKHTTVFGGNLNEVVLGRWGMLEIEDDGGKGLGFKTDHTYIKMRLYADIAVRQERAIIVCPDAKVRA